MRRDDELRRAHSHRHDPAVQAIATGRRGDERRGDLPLYQRILGDAWRALPPAVRDLHDSVTTSTVVGRARVERGDGALVSAVARVFGFPRAAHDIELRVIFTRRNGVETWRREFGDRAFTSVQYEGRGRYGGLLCERFGPFTFGLALVANAGKLELVQRGWSFAGIPLPRAWAPHSTAFEAQAQRRFEFDVAIDLPLVGRLVRYTGWLEPTTAALSEASVQPDT